MCDKGMHRGAACCEAAHTGMIKGGGVGGRDRGARVDAPPTCRRHGPDYQTTRGAGGQWPMPCVLHSSILTAWHLPQP